MKNIEQKLIIGIALAIFFGCCLGGLAPQIAIHFDVLGSVFLRGLMMLVVPLVMLSVIVGMTGLGPVQSIGSIGRNTLFFYAITTGLSVLTGLGLANLIQPGKGLRTTNHFIHTVYEIDKKDNNLLKIRSNVKKKINDSNQKKWVLVLKDQNVQGVIRSISGNAIRVHGWKQVKSNNLDHLQSESGKNIPVQQVQDRFGIMRPSLSLTGKGFEIKPNVPERISAKKSRSLFDVLHHLFLEMIPTNLFKAMANTQILPLIFFSVLFGAALSSMGEKSSAAIHVFDIANETILKLVQWAMLFAPFGIFGLIAGRIGKAGGFQGFFPELVALSMYTVTVLSGLAFHGFLTLPILLKWLGKRKLFPFAKGMAPALLNAFSTASSSATLPITMNGLVQSNGISKRVTSFVLPLGATMNMDGTALYEAVAALFIAQYYGVTMSLTEQFIIFVTATVAAIGAAGIPEAGLVTMIIVLEAVGLPVEGIGLILTIDWLLDRFRTTVNVWGDGVAAGVIETLEQKAQTV